MNDLPDIAKQVIQRKLTYLSVPKFHSLFDELTRVKARNVEGNFVEFGVALGGSAICIAGALDGGRAFRGFDVFGMIPPPSEIDGKKPNQRYEIIKSGKSTGIGGDEYYGYVPNLVDAVKANFVAMGLPVDGERIGLVEGRFEETLSTHADFPIAFAHVDCDWYESARCCLEHLGKKLTPGGVAIFDDYRDWKGCKKAVKEFLRANPRFSMLRTRPHAVLVRTR
jgi:O-methyltransferase